MKKRHKRARKKSNNSRKTSGVLPVTEDISLTVHHYADSSVKNPRVGKSLLSVEALQKVDFIEKVTTVSDEEGSYEEEFKSEENDLLLDTTVTQNQENCGNIYPFDFWVLMSMYIQPDSVSTFACLCKSSYLASVMRVTFWINLYERFSLRASDRYFSEHGRHLLPLKLQRSYVSRNTDDNLRLMVIRSLFHTHPPFKERLLGIHLRLDPHSTVGKICLGIWSVHKANSFRIFMKVTSSTLGFKSKFFQSNSSEIPDSWYDSDEDEIVDISRSPEEFHQLLQLDCTGFCPLDQSVSGLRILQMNITSDGDGFRYQKCSMVMGPPHLRPTKNFRGHMTTSANAVTLTIGNITAMNLFPWFHPCFQ